MEQKVRVFKLSKNPDTFKTPLDSLKWLAAEPKVGSRLFFFTDKEAQKGIATSTIRALEVHPWGWVVYTRNSTYEVEKQ